MKFAKLFMAIAVVCLAVACGGAGKQVDKAQKHVEKKEWVKAAEELAKIDPADMAKEAKEKSDVYKDAEKVAEAIINSGDAEAMKIFTEWNTKFAEELAKLEKEEKK